MLTPHTTEVTHMVKKKTRIMFTFLVFIFRFDDVHFQRNCHNINTSDYANNRYFFPHGKSQTQEILFKIHKRLRIGFIKQ